MTVLQEDGKTIELDDDSVAVSARVDGTVYGISFPIEEDSENLRFQIIQSVDSLLEDIGET